MLEWVCLLVDLSHSLSFAGKFLHDRSFEDEKFARRQDEEWSKRQENLMKRKRNQDETEDSHSAQGAETTAQAPDSSSSKLPFACAICRRSFQETATICAPVRTLCLHYFCENCALDHAAKSTRCAICRAPTQGIFNSAPEIAIQTKSLRGTAEQDNG